MANSSSNADQILKKDSDYSSEDVLLMLEEQGLCTLPESDEEDELLDEFDSDIDEDEEGAEEPSMSSPVSPAPTVDEEDMDEEDNAASQTIADLKWKKQLDPRNLLSFGGASGNKKRLKKDVTPWQCFLLFFTMETFEFIAEMTNMNALRKFSHRAETWKEVTPNDIIVFLALFITMGIVRIANVKDYWQKKYSIIDIPSFNKIMSRNRFFDILHTLHFCDESEAPSLDDPKRDRIYKIRPIMECLLEKFKSVHVPGKNLSIDESLIPFKGRIIFRQFIPSKRARFGIKVFVLADSRTGYVSRLKLYTGRESHQKTTVGLPTIVVQELIRPYTHLGHHLYLDNYYSSPELYNWLYENGVYACGTIRANRKGFPKELVIQKVASVKRGYSQWRACGPLLAQSWVDNRAVYFLSTIHDPEYPSDEKPRLVNRRKKNGSSGPMKIPSPPLLKDYNKNMGGVDLSDQMRKYFSLNRKSNAWYRKVFFYMVELAVHNARVVNETAIGATLNGKEFRLDLVEEMVAKFQTPNRRMVAKKLKNLGCQRLCFDIKHHLPEISKKRSRCVVCSKKYEKGIIESYDQISKINTRCPDCEVFLCLTSGRNCFKQWHSKEKYWL